MLLVVEVLIAWLERVPASYFSYVMNSKRTFGVPLDRTLLSDSSSLKASTFYHRKENLFLATENLLYLLANLHRKEGLA